MECSQIRAILFEHMDTEIPAEFKEEVDAHLAVCRSCAMQLEALRDQLHALGTLPKLEAPRDLFDHVRSRLEKPSIFSVLGQWLRHLFAGKRFFQLAGAAAAAALVIVTVQVALRDGGSRKVLLSSAPLSVESPAPPGTAPSAETPPAPPASPKSLPDNRTNTKKALTAASSATEPHHPAGNETQMVALTLKPPGPSTRVENRSGPFGLKTHNGSFGPESFSLSSRGATGMGAPGGKMREQEAPTGVAGSAEVSEGSPPQLEAQKALSDVIRLIERANGKILSAGESRDGNEPGTVLADMPGTSYPSFLAQLRQFGEVKFNGGKEVNPSPNTKVRVSVSLDTGLAERK